jgi:serine/threonine protein kinase
MFIALPNNTILQNRYKIVNLLGKGGMGAVYHAYHLYLKTEVAIKQTILTGDNDFIIAFNREASLLANLHHSALPKVTDFFTENDGHFIVMELITGEDLEEQLKTLQKQNVSFFSFPEVLDHSKFVRDCSKFRH